MDAEPTKRCCACGELKPEGAFHRSAQNPDGLQAYCKECSTARHAAWAAAHPHANRDSKRHQYERDAAGAILNQMKQRARRAGVSCTLRVADVRELLSAATVCPVLGIPLERHSTGDRGGPSDNSPSIDRLSSAGGYVLGNVAVISQRANRIKNNASLDELRAIVAWMERA